MNDKPKWVKNLSMDERLNLAKAVVENLRQLPHSLFYIFASAKYFVFSDHFTNQVGKSFAAHAFFMHQHMHIHFLIVRVCSLWDSPSYDRKSLPTIKSLIEDANIKSIIRDDIYKRLRKNRYT